METAVTYPGKIEGPNILSALPAGPSEQGLARAVMIVSLLFFAVAVPFAKEPLVKIWAFIPIYESALAINDLITAVLLIGQLHISRSRAMLMLVSGYLFTWLMTSMHALSFPGLFAEQGLIGGDGQTTAWLYMFWHAGFPLCVIAYARLQGEIRGDTRRSLLTACAWVLFAVSALTLAATQGGIVPLPALMVGNHYTPTMIGVVSTVWLLSLAALAALWRRRMRSVLDLWLMAVMCAWLCDVALSAVFNGGRFDLGFYAGRLYGLLAASFVLLVLLVENGWLYARLLDATAELRRLMAADALTGIANRRAFDESLDREWRRSARTQAPLSLLMIDVDHFKKFNDCYGHVVGDECLRKVAGILARSAKRGGEVAARYGGEEFAVLLPDIDSAGALRMARHICESIAASAIPHVQSPTSACITVSIGVACMRPGVSTADKPEANCTRLVERADTALYVAKAEGRNRAHAAAEDAGVAMSVANEDAGKDFPSTQAAASQIA